MPSFAELRAKAEKAKDASIHKLHDTRDKYSSQSSKNLDWDANHKRPPPGQVPVGHTRNSSSVSSQRSVVASPPPRPPPQRGPPLVSRGTRPDSTASHTPSPPPAQVTHSFRAEKIDWSNLSQEDKEVFFAWLDEFFERLFKVKIPPRQSAPTVQVTSRPVTPPRPPTIPTWSRPSQPSTPSNDSLLMSYPPPTIHGSSALDLAMYFSPSTHWDTPWYLSSELPPPLQEESPPTFSAAWEMHGPFKTIFGGVLFADLSMCWYSVQYSTINPNASPNDTSAVRRSVKYLPRPSPRDRQTLIDAHETYGETIAAFAESFEGTGQYCARGECWDLAAEALKYVAQFDYVPPPVPSISRTHGHLIFEGKASRGGAVQAGRWRGGDDRVRRGDIVEWRSARVGRGPYGYSVLGAPDHTAVVVSDSVPTRAVADGEAVSLADLGSLEVVEQSVGKPPARQTYDLSQMQEGEVWVYRPIGIETYVGTSLTPECPDNVQALTV